MWAVSIFDDLIPYGVSSIGNMHAEQKGVVAAGAWVVCPFSNDARSPRLILFLKFFICSVDGRLNASPRRSAILGTYSQPDDERLRLAFSSSTHRRQWRGYRSETLRRRPDDELNYKTLSVINKL